MTRTCSFSTASPRLPDDLRRPVTQGRPGSAEAQLSPPPAGPARHTQKRTRGALPGVPYRCLHMLRPVWAVCTVLLTKTLLRCGYVRCIVVREIAPALSSTGDVWHKAHSGDWSVVSPRARFTLAAIDWSPVVRGIFPLPCRFRRSAA